MMQRMKLRETAQCPRCDQEENAAHVWRCQNPDTQQIWTESIKKLAKWMEENDTHPRLAEDIITGLTHWRDGTQPPEYLSEAGQQQEQAGWQQFFEARPVPTWRTLQQRHFTVMKLTTKSSLRWITAIHVRLLNTAWDFWSQRNDILHRSELQLKWESLNKEMIDVHRKCPPNAPSWLQELFAETVPELMNKSGEYRLAWVQGAKAGLLKYDSEVVRG
jgi:hypothetical protein